MIVAPLVLGLVACSDDEFSSRSPDGGSVDVGPLPRPDDTEPAATTPSGATTDTAPEPGTTEATPTTDDTSDTTPPTVPVSGVPGIDDSGALCESWSRLAGTRQLLTLAANFGELGADDLAGLEIVAASLVTAAAEQLDAALTEVGADVAAVADEHDLVMDDLLGRMLRRAEAAQAALDELDPPDGTTDLLAQVWLDGLRKLGPDDVQPSLADLGPEIGPLVEQAASVFADDAPRWNEDPDLDVADVSVPATTALVADRCPDLTIVGIGDAV